MVASYFLGVLVGLLVAILWRLAARVKSGAIQIRVVELCECGHEDEVHAHAARSREYTRCKTIGCGCEVFTNKREEKMFTKLMALVLALALLSAPVAVQAEEYEHGNADPVIGTAVMGAWAGAVAAAGGASSNFVVQATPVAPVVFGIVAGTIISATTDPEDEGRGYRWNGQADVIGEERKFENNPNWPGWKRIKGHPTPGYGFVQEPVSYTRQFEIHGSQSAIDRIGQ